MCGCNPGVPPMSVPGTGPTNPYPREPMMRPQQGFDVFVTPTPDPQGKVCSGWKIDPSNATKEVNLCCTPSVGRAGGRLKVAACLKISRDYDPFA